LPGGPATCNRDVHRARLAGHERTSRRTARLSFPDNSSPGEIYPSYVDLPTPGCSVLTLRWSSHSGTIDVQVHARQQAQARRT
jgi:hypothetical protein